MLAILFFWTMDVMIPFEMAEDRRLSVTWEACPDVTTSVYISDNDIELTWEINV